MDTIPPGTTILMICPKCDGEAFKIRAKVFKDNMVETTGLECAACGDTSVTHMPMVLTVH